MLVAVWCTQTSRCSVDFFVSCGMSAPPSRALSLAAFLFTFPFCIFVVTQSTSAWAGFYKTKGAIAWDEVAVKTEDMAQLGLGLPSTRCQKSNALRGPGPQAAQLHPWGVGLGCTAEDALNHSIRDDVVGTVTGGCPPSSRRMRSGQ